MIQTSHYCATCGRQTLHTKARVNHVLHLILSVLTAGLWLFVWAALGMSNSASRTRCAGCGSKPGLQSLKHDAGLAGSATTIRERFASLTAPSSAPTASVVDGEVAPSTWLPPGARPPR